MSSARQQALDAIKVGDIIFGLGAGGQEKLMLVYKIHQDSIFARHVTSQAVIEFGRDGKSLHVPDGGSCTIVSTATLPDGQYSVAIGLDRKMRTGKDYPDFVLSEAEIGLLLSKGDFYRAHPLPE
jgi:hypothetical protein